ncbi:MAG: transposase [Bacteroidetes bacterium]|nr:transposase [Bacteroidota bacterium]
MHPFDKICIQNKIQHRTIKFRHPWTNGMVERFNRTLREKVLDRQMFCSIFEMEGKLIEFVNKYNLEKRLKIWKTRSWRRIMCFA